MCQDARYKTTFSLFGSYNCGFLAVYRNTKNKNLLYCASSSSSPTEKEKRRIGILDEQNVGMYYCVF